MHAQQRLYAALPAGPCRHPGAAHLRYGPHRRDRLPQGRSLPVISGGARMSEETAYIVLFRGVGGATQLPVKRLREVLSEAGFNNVSTYINSGNAVLSSPLAEGEVVERVAAVVREKRNFEKSVLARSRADWS